MIAAWTRASAAGRDGHRSRPSSRRRGESGGCPRDGPVDTREMTPRQSARRSPARTDRREDAPWRARDAADAPEPAGKPTEREHDERDAEARDQVDVGRTSFRVARRLRVRRRRPRDAEPDGSAKNGFRAHVRVASTPAAVRLELLADVLEVGADEHTSHAVDDARADEAPHALVAHLASRGHEVDARPERAEQRRHLLGRVLEVAVHGHDDPPPRLEDAAAERRRLPEVARHGEDAHRGAPQPRRIAGVRSRRRNDEHDLERRRPRRVRATRRRTVASSKADDDRDVRRRADVAHGTLRSTRRASSSPSESSRSTTERCDSNGAWSCA